MEAQIKIAKAAFVPGLLAAAGVLAVQMVAPAKQGAQLAAAAIGGILGVIIAANIK